MDKKERKRKKKASYREFLFMLDKKLIGLFEQVYKTFCQQLSTNWV